MIFCPRCCQDNEFNYVDNVIHAENRFGRLHHRSPDEIPGPSLQCTRCKFLFINRGTHLEAAEPDYLPAA